MTRPTKKQLEKYLGKIVKITIFTNEVICGELHQTGEEQFKNNPSLYYRMGYYFLINPQSFLFRISHVKKVEVIEDEK
ncbi:MAG: hypothetical protein PHC62_03970 [Candidatus Izemoplasmatales bacterium]|nr:hypothetical protein [Candidatus Izemoplasmatales bacterium]